MQEELHRETLLAERIVACYPYTQFVGSGAIGTHQFAAGGGSRPIVCPVQAGYDAFEQAYTEWVRRFVDRLSARLPDEPCHEILAAAERWTHQSDRLGAEEAAEIAAMWWDASRSRGRMPRSAKPAPGA